MSYSRPLVAALLVSLSGAAAQAANLLADYQFHGSLASSGVAAPLLEGINGVYFSGSVVQDMPTDTASFTRGSGLRMTAPDAISVNGYTVVILFTFDENTGYRKILDFKDRSSDSGFYALSGQLNFYPVTTAPTPTISTSVFSQVVLTRTAAGIVTAYTDGIEQFSFQDSADYTLLATNSFTLFADDFATGQAEASAGRVARIRLYDSALTATEIAALDYAVPGGCGFADFNGDGDVGTDADLEAFFACLGGQCCPTCGSADFDADGDIGTDADIEAFFRILSGSNC